MASVERIQGAIEDAQQNFLEAGKDLSARTEHVGGSIAALRALLGALDEAGIMGEENPSIDQLNAALQIGNQGRQQTDQGLSQLRAVTAGARSETAIKMVRAAAKANSDYIESQARMTMASEALNDLIKPMTALRDAVEGVINQLVPEAEDGENHTELQVSLDTTDGAISDYNKRI